MSVGTISTIRGDAMRTVGSLFSGIGGMDLGLERAGYDITWQVENNEYCRKVLKKHWPSVPCHADIKTIDWRDIPAVDLVCGGFPCQPFSVAGKRAGTADDRYLWPEVVRCLDVLRPTWFLGENVPGLINMALDQVCTDLEGLGYEVWPVCVPACAVDAPHLRQRIWIVAYCTSNHQWGSWEAQRKQQVEVGGRGTQSCENVAHTHAQREPQPQGDQQGQRGRTLHCGEDVANSQQAGWTAKPRQEYRQWPIEPAICRVADGVSNRIHRLKGLGNAVVPAIVEALGRMILQCHLVNSQEQD